VHGLLLLIRTFTSAPGDGERERRTHRPGRCGQFHGLPSGDLPGSVPASAAWCGTIRWADRPAVG